MKPQVLVIEPDKVLAETVCKFLRRQGLGATWQASAQTAVEAADQNRPSAVVLDIQLARHGGIELIHELRSYHDWHDIPVIIYSSVHPDELGGEAAANRLLTSSAYLYKPSVTMAKLASTIKQVIGK